MCSRLEISDLEEDCSPIRLLDELKNWKCSTSKKYFTHALQKRRCIKDHPKTLVCHDMKGGYLEDRFIYGSKSEKDFYFIHWSMVDIFVYFSHHLVTIPPCSWISSAHRNGVKVLGTFITEWEAGKERCDSIFCDIESVHQVCLQLVNIASFYEFDGWLVNIENKLDPNQVPLLEEFVRFLTLKMHETRQDSVVIWYDSVIQSGELKWQNELNELNRNFFDACDGIFLNYNWKQDNLKKSIEEAGIRKVDIYVGVDVFGRGCLGGGGFSTDIAVTAARDHNLSVAIFAPGWVYECLDSEDFTENQYKFWNSLIELCPVREIEGLPYYSSFCPGFGLSMFRNGKMQSGKPWYNLSLQQPQPSYHYTNCSAEGSLISNYCFDAFNGGGCLQLKSQNQVNNFAEFQILSTNFLINTDCCVSYTFKSKDKDVKVALIFNIFNGNKQYCLKFLCDSDDCSAFEETSNSVCPSCTTSDVPKVSTTSTKLFKSDYKSEGSWIRRKYKLYCHANESYCIKSVGVQLRWQDVHSPEISVLLGELMISPQPQRTLFSYKDLSVVPKDEICYIECYLEWSCDVEIDYSDLYILVNDVKNHICRTSQFCFTFKGSIENTDEVQFILHPKQCGKDAVPVCLKVPLDLDKNFMNHV